MAPPIFSFSMTGVPFNGASSLWPDALSRTKIGGRMSCEDEKDFLISIDSFAFAATTVNFWALHRVTYRRTQRDCARSPNSYYSLCLVKEGSAEITQRGKTFLAQSDDCFLVNLAEPYIQSRTRSFQFRALRIPAGLVKSLIPCPQNVTAMPLPKESDWGQALAVTMHTLTMERMETPAFTQKFVYEHICYMLSLATDPTEQLLKNSKASMLQRFRKSLELHFFDPEYSPKKLADEHKVSTRTLFSVFSAAKSSFGRELLGYRMENACRILSDPRFDTKSVAEVGLLVGFLHPSYFATCFNKIYGLTPSAFRASHQERKDNENR